MHATRKPARLFATPPPAARTLPGDPSPPCRALRRHHSLAVFGSRPSPLARAPQMRSLGSRFFHASASLQQRVLGEAAWGGAYTFALVRNPYARQVSMFHFLLTEASCHRATRPSHCEQRKLPKPGVWLKDQQQVIFKFQTWIREMAAAFPVDSPSAHLFGARSHGNEIDPWYNASQLSWLVDASGKLLVNEVIKLEELESKWPQLQARICGFAQSPYSEDVDLRKNPSSHAHYSAYYDDDTRRITDRYMGLDLKAFGYTFETEAETKAKRDT